MLRMMNCFSTAIVTPRERGCALRHERLLRAVTMALAWCVAVPALSFADEAVKRAATHDLRPHFKEGQSSLFEFWRNRTTKSESTMPWGQRSASHALVSEGQVRWVVNEVRADGTATCTMTLKWLSIQLDTADGEPTTIDSREDADDENPMAMRVRAFIDKPLRIEMAADGTPGSVDGMDAINDELEEKLGGSTLEEAMFLEQAATLATIPGATEGVEPQGTWVSTHTWKRDYGKLREAMQYRLDSVAPMAGIPVATITGEAELTVEPDDEDLPEGANMDVQMTEGLSTAQIMLDLQRHEVVGRNALEVVRLEITAGTEQMTISSVVEERVQSQVWRVAEEEEAGGGAVISDQ